MHFYSEKIQEYIIKVDEIHDEQVRFTMRYHIFGTSRIDDPNSNDKGCSRARLALGKKIQVLSFST